MNKIPTISQKKYIDEIINMMKIKIDFIVCGFEGIGKTFCIEKAIKNIGFILIRIDESITLEQIKTYISTCVIRRNDVYFHISESMLKKSYIKKMIENRMRKTPLVIEIKSKYNIPSVVSKMARMAMYFPRPNEVKSWFKQVYRKDLSLVDVQNFKNINTLINHFLYNSEIPEIEPTINKVVGAIIKTTDNVTRLKHIMFLQKNSNVKYILKLILFNSKKFYSNYSRFNVIRLLSICDNEKNLYPLLLLPKIESKYISREVTYQKEMNVNV